MHGGNLIAIDATRYLQSADNIIDGFGKAIELYKPYGIPVMFDLQVKTDILGCKLACSKENPPAVISNPLSAGLSFRYGIHLSADGYLEWRDVFDKEEFKL